MQGRGWVRRERDRPRPWRGAMPLLKPSMDCLAFHRLVADADFKVHEVFPGEVII